MPTGRKRQPFQAVLGITYAAFLVISAFLIRLTLVRRFGIIIPPFILFYPVVILSALLFGLWSGVTATALSASLTAFWIFHSIEHFRDGSTSNLLLVAIFSAMGIFISAFAERWRRTQYRLATLEGDQALYESRVKWDAAMASMQESIFIADTEGQIVDFNDAFATFHKFKRKAECPTTSAEYHALLEVFTSDGAVLPGDMWPVRRALGGATVSNVEYTIRRRDTGKTWVGSYNFSPIRDKDGAISGVVVAARDVTERKRAEAALRTSEVRYRTAFQTSLDAIAINRLSDGLCIDVNSAFLDLMGYDRGEVIGRTSLELDIWADHQDRENMIMILQRRSACREFQAKFQKKSGQVCWGIMSASTIEIDGETCVLAVFRDISDIRLAREEIRNLAFFDPLTEVANRRLLMNRLETSISFISRKRGQRALLLVDLDNFMMLNGRLGHQMGDLLLREVAQRLTSCVREIDTVGRVGADEFFVLLESLSDTPKNAALDAKAFGENILANVSRPYFLDTHEILCTCSIGITVFADTPCEVSDVLQQADFALSQAKAAQKNEIRVFTPQ